MTLRREIRLMPEWVAAVLVGVVILTVSCTIGIATVYLEKSQEKKKDDV